LDDVDYRVFFSASRQREGSSSNKRVRCTIVDWCPSHPSWYEPAALKALNFPKDHVVQQARDIFGTGYVRFFGGGVPDVFLDETGKATPERLEYLLNSEWV
jgi:hypothetical protein